MPRIELGSKPWQGLIIAVILHPPGDPEETRTLNFRRDRAVL